MRLMRFTEALARQATLDIGYRMSVCNDKGPDEVLGASQDRLDKIGRGTSPVQKRAVSNKFENDMHVRCAVQSTAPEPGLPGGDPAQSNGHDEL